MRYLSIITTFLCLLVMLASCDSSLTSNKSSDGLLSPVQGGVNTLSSTTPNDPLFSQQNYLNTANVPQAWQTTNGSSIKEIAVIALGGIDNSHEDLTRVTIKRAAGSPVADNGAANPAAGIIGATTDNGKGIAGVNWNAPVFSYNIGKATTATVNRLPNGPYFSKTFVELDENAVAPAINEAVNDGAKTIYMPLYWLLEDQVPELSFADFQFYPCCILENPFRQIYDNAVNIFNSIAATTKQNNDYNAAIAAVKDAYESGSVVVSGALPYDGILPLGFPANLASEHVVLTVGGFDTPNFEPFQFSGTPEGDDVSTDPRDINLIAPGVDLLTTLPDGNQYGEVDGTYASAALTTGIVSLLQSAEGDLTPDDVAHILEKTAIPIGPPGYDSQAGFGIIDAGAAMDFVNTHDIKHGTATNGQVEELFTGELITFYTNSIWSNLAAGAYFADKYKVTYTIPMVPSSDNDLWFNAGGTLGLSPANPNDQNRYANVEMFSDHAEVTMYIYKLYTTTGVDLKWHPASPENAQLSYSYVGEISTSTTNRLDAPALSGSVVNDRAHLDWSPVPNADNYAVYERNNGDQSPSFSKVTETTNTQYDGVQLHQDRSDDGWEENTVDYMVIAQSNNGYKDSYQSNHASFTYYDLPTFPNGVNSQNDSTSTENNKSVLEFKKNSY